MNTQKIVFCVALFSTLALMIMVATDVRFGCDCGSTGSSRNTTGMTFNASVTGRHRYQTGFTSDQDLRKKKSTCGSFFPNFSSAFCNFDGFLTGFCDSCSKFETKYDCENDGLPLKGADECFTVCVKNQN